MAITVSVLGTKPKKNGKSKNGSPGGKKVIDLGTSRMPVSTPATGAQVRANYGLTGKGKR